MLEFANFKLVISTGNQIGRYKIRSAIGKGGMGEVYLAEDTELDRLVALKVLPIDVANDTERLRRFIQEATHLESNVFKHVTCQPLTEICYCLWQSKR